MRPIFERTKYMICMAVIIAILLLDGGRFYVSAAASSISVTSAITGEQMYAGDDLQEAFDAAERGCIVSIGRYITLPANVVLRAEVMLSGYSYIKFGEYQIQLTENGALFVDTRIRSKYIGALNAYSQIEWMEESGGFIYYLVTQAPSFEGERPMIHVTGNVLGFKVDEASGIIYQDVAVGGILAEDMGALVTMSAKNAETIEISFQDTVYAEGKSYIVNGTAMIAAASNYDYAEKVTKSYRIILLGDVNGNGRVDSADASLVACHANGTKPLSGIALLAADADQDGAVTAADANMICKKYVRRDSYHTPLAQ